MATGRSTIRWLCVIPVVMFGFAFALIPLYNVLCQQTGLNGKIDFGAPVQAQAIDYSRTVTVEFVTTMNQGLKGSFIPKVARLQVHPGEMQTTSFEIINGTGHDTVFQAIPSITPGLAANAFKKIECFCFERQPMLEGQLKVFPLKFTLDRDLPKDIQTLTLSYTLFELPAGETP